MLSYLRTMSGRLVFGIVVFALYCALHGAEAKDQNVFTEELRTLLMTPVNGFNTIYIMEQKYLNLYNDPSLSEEQKAMVLASRAGFRGSEGDNKVGQLADLDLLVQLYPNAESAERYKEDRAYAYVQTWHMTNRILKGQNEDKMFAELWSLGYWDDAVDVLTKAKRPVELDGILIRDLQREGYIKGASSGKGGGSSSSRRTIVRDDHDQEFAINGYNLDAPNEKLGDNLKTSLEALRTKAAQYKD
ncbi:hypothetical protein FF098_015455 [Parvularcula flava]|uniref:Uncharacterized protein n=1 Tax=Aquisalinus luteolus TaxID=1566827 RepID=A0A8J3EQ71_9PROT|nr:hypothetical protein [Aquisalinus luteolus]NHK29314.1 hypothetical protein [Aquisalinus luteolus]GGI01155.1 hypothetical protein GCM10011355_31130 [Aquisalinus luteolus]